MTTALYGGSFDPVHLGHLSLIRTAAGVFDAVVVVVLANPSKTSGLFTRPERARLVRESIEDLDNVSVHEFHGLIVEAAAELGADLLLRSVHKEGPAEREMAYTNAWQSGLPTYMAVPDLQTSWISSSVVRTAVKAGRSDLLLSLVSEPVLRALTPTTASR